MILGVQFMQAQLLTFSQKGKWGLCEINGKLLYPPSADYISKVSNLYYKIFVNQKQGIVTSSGNVLLKAEFEKIECFTNYFAVKNKNWALADTAGKFLTDFIYSGIHEVQPDLVLLNGNSKQVILNTFTMAQSAQYKQIYYSDNRLDKNTVKPGIRFSNFDTLGALYKETLAEAVKCVGCSDAWTEGRFGFSLQNKEFDLFVDNQEIKTEHDWKNYRLLSSHFLQLSPYKKTPILVSAYTKKAYVPHVNCQGYYLVTDSMIAFMVDSMYGIMDFRGNIIFPPSFETSPMLRADGYIEFQKGGLKGIMNKKFTSLIKEKYKVIALFQNNLAVARNSEQKNGIINTQGDTILDFRYYSIKFQNKTIKAYRDGGMLVCKLNENNQIQDSSFYENVKTLEVNNSAALSIYPSMTTIKNKDGNTSNFNQLPPALKESKDYKVISKTLIKHQKIRSIIPNAQEHIKELQGLRYIPTKYSVLKEIYWDLRLEDCQASKIIRMVNEGGKTSFFHTETKKITNKLSCELNGKKGLYEIVYLGPFSSGYARVNVGGIFGPGTDIRDGGQPYRHGTFRINKGKWAYLNGNGNLATNFVYDYASDFHHGQAIVSVGGKFGIIDSTFHWIIKPTYEHLSFLPNSDFRLYQSARYQKEIGIVDNAGNIIIQGGFERIAFPFDDWIAFQKGKWGFCDRKGNIVIAPQYLAANSFSDGLAAVKKEKYWIYIDKTGTQIIEGQFQRADAFHDGIAAVMKDNKWMLIDKTGNQIGKQEPSQIKQYYHNTWLAQKDKRWGLLGSNGKWKVAPKYLQLKYLKPFNLIAAKDKKGWKILNLEGDELNKKTFSNITTYKENFCAVQVKKHWGFIDSTGKLVIKDVYATVSPFSEYRALVKHNGKYGFIDTTGNMIIEAKYSKALSFYDGKALVDVADGNCLYIDPLGKQLYKTDHLSIPSGNLRGAYFIRYNTLYDSKNQAIIQSVGSANALGPILFKIIKNQRTDEKIKHPVIVCQRDLSVLQEVHDISMISQEILRYASLQQFGVINFEGKEISPPINGKIEFSDNLIKISNWTDVEFIKPNGENLIPD
jgi:hypothetical protein